MKHLNYTPPPALLSGRNILISGASRGIGRALSIACGRLGAQCILLARDLNALESTADAIVAAGGSEPLLQPIDLEHIDGKVAQTLAEHILALQGGALHGLVNNAAVLGSRQPLQTYREDEWERVMRINVRAPFILTQALLPALMLASDASIINVSSGVGRRGRAYWGAYAVSKFALEGMTQVLADEMENTSHIRVNSLDPGGVATQMRAQAKPAEDPSTLPQAEDIIGSFLYLLGPQSKGVHAQSLCCY